METAVWFQTLKNGVIVVMSLQLYELQYLLVSKQGFSFIGTLILIYFARVSVKWLLELRVKMGLGEARIRNLMLIFQFNVALFCSRRK